MGTDTQTVESGRWRTAVAAVLGLYAVGLVLAEAVLQAGAILATALALALAVTKRLRLEKDVRAFVLASVALCAWQLVSPAVALMTGAATKWPRGARYGQALDTVAGAAVACVGTLGVPWLMLGSLIAGGWLLAAALGLFQHRVPWPWEPPKFTKLNLARLHENFGTEENPRYAAGGFFFHRLRFAHGAIAVLGPALAVIGRSKVTRRRVLAGVMVLGLLLSIYGAFARAALGAALGVCVLALLLLLRGTARKAGLGVAVALVAVVLLTPAWRERFGKAVDNLFGSGERSLAMSVGWRLVREHPWVGVGFGNHKPAALATQAETGITDLLATDSHNLWLTAWAETGLVGLVLLATMHVLLARALVRRHRAGSIPATGALLSFVGFHVLALVHYLPFHPSVHLSFMLIWGLGLCGYGQGSQESAKSA
ncbi:O-antigen ligase domain-containing protein [Corallococcus sp. AB045]|uniref:O-antigen ligase family protein n=1 Tax=Corallococcus sp. AB045 TaxID=2316719 RepID=UPI000EE1BED5|nr:O-antigen ligase family protein [Corallococcus sp. AB045]RKH86993.1 O-antigen ligase domain-containing protein [Corallococcus sp. AB045]